MESILSSLIVYEYLYVSDRLHGQLNYLHRFDFWEGSTNISGFSEYVKEMQVSNNIDHKHCLDTEPLNQCYPSELQDILWNLLA